MPPQIIPIAGGGVGAYTWDRSPRESNRYYVRRGRDVIAYVTLADTVPVKDRPPILDSLCASLNQTGDTTS